MKKLISILFGITLIYSNIQPALMEAAQGAGAEAPAIAYNYNTFNEWHTIVSQLPDFRTSTNQGTALNHPDKDKQNDILPISELKYTIKQFYNMLLASSMTNPSLWISNAPEPGFFASTAPSGMKPFVQKLIVEQGSEISFHGDIHGDVHSLTAMIKALQDKNYMDKEDGFKIIKPNFYMVFLGDYVDRGIYSVETLYTLLRLKIENPEKVFLIRGDHETPGINSRHGFGHELSKKYGPDKYRELHKEINHVFNYFTMAIYLGTKEETEVCSAGAGGAASPASAANFILCCHGGPEMGFDPKTLIGNHALATQYQWLGELDIKGNLEKGLDFKNDADEIFNSTVEGSQTFKPTDYFELKFFWNDFVVNPEEKSSFKANRGFKLNQNLTEKILAFGSVQEAGTRSLLKGVFRGHQHNFVMDDMMKSILLQSPENASNEGVSKLSRPKGKPLADSAPNELWNNIICTFLVSPGTVYGLPDPTDIEYRGFDYDAYGILTTASSYYDWKLDMHKNIIFK